MFIVAVEGIRYLQGSNFRTVTKYLCNTCVVNIMQYESENIKYN